LFSIGDRKEFDDRILEISTVFVPGGTVVKVFSFVPERCTDVDVCYNWGKPTQQNPDIIAF
jgi:hypothetical protein